MASPGSPDDRPPPRDAATVVVVRNAKGALELFCVQRSARSGFMAGAVVFPGGKVDADDASAAWEDLTTELPERAAELAGCNADARTFCIAALRETLEEGEILPVAGDQVDSLGARELRQSLARSSSLHGLLADRRLQLDVARLEPLGRWVTPSAEPKRFDTRFYLLPCPTGQSGSHDRHETTHSFWARPREILARWERGELFLAPPTSHTIGLFADARTVDEAVAIARAQSLEPARPEFAEAEGRMILALPGDPLYPAPEAPPHPKGVPERFVLEGARFVAKPTSRR